MKKLFEGVHRFSSGVIFRQKEMFNRLAKEQNPETLFITCSDSRICPNLMTQTQPGEIFIVRNAGNLIPPHGAFEGGTGATIEFAVVALGVTNIIVCGHSNCGAIKGILHPEQLAHLPLMLRWLTNAESTREIMKTAYADLVDEEHRQQIAAQENVLVQVENLRTHPCVAARLIAGKLKLHAWMYQIDTSEVFAYDPEDGQYELITETADINLLENRGRIQMAASI